MCRRWAPFSRCGQICAKYGWLDQATQRADIPYRLIVFDCFHCIICYRIDVFVYRALIHSPLSLTRSLLGCEVRGLQHPVALCMGIIFNVIIAFCAMRREKKHTREIVISSLKGSANNGARNKSYLQRSISIDINAISSDSTQLG